MDTAKGTPWALFSSLIESKLDAVHCPISCDHNLRTMSNILELNCWILSHDPRRIFSVEVPSSKTVSHLKDAIKDKKKHTFTGIDADLLDLWKVSDCIQHTNNDEFISLKVNIDLTTNSDLLKSIKVVGDIPDGEELKPWDDISETLTDPRRKHLHIIVKRPAGRHLSTVVKYSPLT